MYTIVTPSGAEYSPPPGTCWKNVEEVYLQQAAEGRFWYGSDGKGIPRRKTYLSEKDGRNMWTWWPNSEVGHTQEATKELKSLFPDQAAVFDFPKPLRLIKRMISIASKDDDIVFDFFSGSATTAHAVMQLNAEDGGNRHFILVQLPEVCDEKSEAFKAGFRNICEIGKERIRRAGTKILAEAEQKRSQLRLDGEEQHLPDVGFRVFKLDSSNLKTWDDTPLEREQLEILYDRMNDMIDRVKPDRSDLDMVFEVMLKMGVPLTYPVTTIDIHGKPAYSVGEDTMLLIFLSPGVTPEDVVLMADYAPARVIISSEAFTDNTDMANAYYILRDKGIGLKLI